MDAVAGLAPGSGLIAAACTALGLSRASLHRRQAFRRQPPEPVRRRPPPMRALVAQERQVVLHLLREPRFVDLAPAEVYACLLDLARALDQAILLEQTDVHSQLRENFLLEPFHKLLVKEERDAKRLKWLSILIAASGVLIGLGILLSLTILWGGSGLFKSNESPTLLASALGIVSVVSIIAGVIGVFSAWRFKRRKELLAFESEVLHRYLRTRSELLKTQVNEGRP